MALYEYKCEKCGKVTTFLEKISNKENFFQRLKRKCKDCGSHRLVRLISTFTAVKHQSSADMLNEISRMGPVNFVPDYHPIGPPPGGCPYSKQGNNTHPSS